MTDVEQAPAAFLPPPPPEACCLMGQVYFEAYARAVRNLTNPDVRMRPDPALVVSQLAEVVDHLVTMHDAQGRQSDQCAGCLRYAGNPPPDISVHDWQVDTRAHQVAHTLIDGGGLLLGT